MSYCLAHSSRLHRRCPSGFTLLESALATVIIGVGMVATMQLFGTCTSNNSVSAQTTVAMMLAGHIQEITAGLAFNDPATGPTTFGPEASENLLSYDDIDDFAAPATSFYRTFNPPIDASRGPINELGNYIQAVSVLPVYPNMLSVNTDETSLDIPRTTYTGAVRVCVRILYQPEPSATPAEVYRTSWIRFDN